MGENVGRGWHELGNALLAARRLTDGAAAYDAAIEGGAAPAASHYKAACALALLGRKDEALDRLEKAVVAGFSPRSAIEADDDLASLRGDARFAAIVARAKP